jgi:hypothetical protein
MKEKENFQNLVIHQLNDQLLYFLSLNLLINLIESQKSSIIS